MSAQLSITGEPAATDEPVDLWSLQCQRLLCIEGWQWFRVEHVEGGTLVTGAVCREKFKSGPRKGRPNWDKRDLRTERKVVLTREQIDAFRAAWEVETGKCVTCGGNGKEWRGWSRDNGHKYRPCQKCNATGKAVQP